MFMGDVGSTFLGAVFAFLVLQSPNWSEAFALLLVATPLLVMLFLRASPFVCRSTSIWCSSIASFSATSSGWVSHARVSSLYIFATIALSIVFSGVVRLGLFPLHLLCC